MLIKCSCLYQPSVSVVWLFLEAQHKHTRCYDLGPDGIEMSSWIICALILFHVTFVLLVLYFNPVLPLAPWKLRGAWRQKGDINNTVCLLPGSWVPHTNFKLLNHPQFFRSCLTSPLASLLLHYLSPNFLLFISTCTRRWARERKWGEIKPVVLAMGQPCL